MLVLEVDKDVITDPEKSGPWLELANYYNKDHSHQAAVTSVLESCWNLEKMWFKASEIYFNSDAENIKIDQFKLKLYFLTWLD